MEDKKVETRQRRKRKATHMSIMHNAKRLFEENGLGKVTIEAITEATDISRSTFFSHFDSVDALVGELSDIAVGDIIEEYRKSNKNGIEGIRVLLNKLIEDTCPYPYLSIELLLNGIVKSRGITPFSEFESIIFDELVTANTPITKYSRKEQTALIMGAYFGKVFQMFIKEDTKWIAEDMKKTLNNILNNIIGE